MNPKSHCHSDSQSLAKPGCILWSLWVKSLPFLPCVTFPVDGGLYRSKSEDLETNGSPCPSLLNCWKITESHLNNRDKILRCPGTVFDIHCQVLASCCSHLPCPSSSWSFSKGHMCNLSLRSLEEPVNANEEENAGPQQAAHTSLQEKAQPSENRWMKYLERESKDLGPEGRRVCFSRQPSSRTEKPEPPFNTGLPRKRKWSQSTVQPPCSPNVQDSGNSQLTLEPQKGDVGLAGNVKEGSGHEDWDTRELTVPHGEPPCPAQQVRTTSSKWERFLLPPGNSSHMDMEPPTALQKGLRPAGAAQAEQGMPRAQTPREGLFSRPLSTLQLPGATHTPTSGPKRPCGKTAEQLWGTVYQVEGGPLVKGTQEAPLVRLCDLFKTGEDFDDDL